jgi:hypothetical protein
MLKPAETSVAATLKMSSPHAFSASKFYHFKATAAALIHRKRLTMRQNRTPIRIKVRFGWQSKPTDSAAANPSCGGLLAYALQFFAVTSAFDDFSWPRYEKLWRISVIRVIVSFLFRIAIRWINARGISYLGAGQ